MARYASEARRLTEDELIFIGHLIKRAGQSGLLLRLRECLIREIDDGGMGSLEFVSDAPGERRLGRVLAETRFEDRDGILVSAALNLDERDDLFELDLWKTDFSRLIALLKESEIVYARWGEKDSLTQSQTRYFSGPSPACCRDNA
jgi:hypothetical protein